MTTSRTLVTLYGGEHMLGGISGYLVTETSDESPLRVAAVQRLTWAYLRTALYPRDGAWPAAVADFESGSQKQGQIDGKRRAGS